MARRFEPLSVESGNMLRVVPDGNGICLKAEHPWQRDENDDKLVMGGMLCTHGTVSNN